MVSYLVLLLILADRVRSIIALVVPVTDELGEISAEVERDAADVLCAVPDRTFIAGIGTLLWKVNRKLPIGLQLLF